MATDADITSAATQQGATDSGDPEELDPENPYVEFVSRISIRDVADLVFTRATRSTGAQGIAGFLMTLGLLGAFGGAQPELWVPPIILSIGIATGFLLLPFIWWRYLAAPDLMQERVQADTSGMIIHVAERAIRHPWTVYRTAQETNRLFILTSRVVRPLMFTKREMPAADSETFRTILAKVDLLRHMDEGPRYRPWLALVSGGAIAIVTVFGARTLQL